MLDDDTTRYLRVGCMLQFVFPLDEQEIQCSAMLVGWKEDAYLISELPLYEGRPLEVHPGAPCIVRYMMDGRVVGYRTDVRAVQPAPEPLLFLAFPLKIEQIVLRKSARIFVNQPVSLVRTEPQAATTGLMKDLSAAGCRVEVTGAAHSYSTGQAVRTEFALPSVGRVSNLVGLIKNVSPRGGHVLLGIEFQFHQMEFIEFHGWGGTVKKAIEQFVVQRQRAMSLPEEVLP